MAAFKVKLFIDQGATFRKSMTWKAGPVGVEVPVDLTGCTARMQIREDIENTAVLAELTTENGGIALGGATGVIDLYIAAAQTTAFTWEAGVYDIEFTFSNGDISRRISGSVVVSPEVTRA